MHHDAVPLLRILSVFGLAAVFVLISPSLRLTIQDGLGHWASQMELYSPYSYIAMIAAILLVFLYSLNRGTQAR